jgi:hypothetical protein
MRDVQVVAFRYMPPDAVSPAPQACHCLALPQLPHLIAAGCGINTTRHQPLRISGEFGKAGPYASMGVLLAFGKLRPLKFNDPHLPAGTAKCMLVNSTAQACERQSGQREAVTFDDGGVL